MPLSPYRAYKSIRKVFIMMHNLSLNLLYSAHHNFTVSALIWHDMFHDAHCTTVKPLHSGLTNCAQ